MESGALVQELGEPDLLSNGIQIHACSPGSPVGAVGIPIAFPENRSAVQQEAQTLIR